MRGVLSTGLMGGLLMSVSLSLAAEEVLVQGVEQGQGVLRARGGECFAIAPQHVVGLGMGLSVVNAERIRAPAEPLTNFGDDIAVIRVAAEGRMSCGRGWPRNEPLDDLLQQAVNRGREGVILRVRDTGGLESHAVRFSALEDRHVEVTLLTPNSEAFKGISGSRLLLDGRPVGMVLKTEMGAIRAYRQDALDQRIGDFFAVGSTHLPPGALPLEPRRGHVIATARTPVREEPTPWSPVVRWLEVGQSVELSAKVKGRPWWQVPGGYVRVRDTTSP
ncbi:hypothetical protein LG302_07415 [Halomonas organivorans]